MHWSKLNSVINPAKTQGLKYVTLSLTRTLNKNKVAFTSHAPCYDYVTLAIYVFYVSFYKNKNNLYKYEAMLVIFVSNSKISGLGDSLIYRDKLSIC